MNVCVVCSSYTQRDTVTHLFCLHRKVKVIKYNVPINKEKKSVNGAHINMFYEVGNTCL